MPPVSLGNVTESRRDVDFQSPQPRKSCDFNAADSVLSIDCLLELRGIAKMSVRVVARIRPLLKSELDKDTIVAADGPVVRIPNPKNESEDFSFQFNSVYGADATQQELFDGEGTIRSHTLSNEELDANTSKLRLP